jgi:hypothetical protein
MNGSIDVRLSQGSPQSVKLVAPQSLHSLFKVSLNDGIAYISQDQCYNSSKETYMEIVTARLESVSLNGAGSILGSGTFMLTELEIDLGGSGDIEFSVDAAEIHVENDGAGDVLLDGEVKELSIEVDGSGDVLAKRLEAEEVEASVDGSGSIEVHAKEKLKASVNGSGDVRYKGKPDVKSNISGSGEVSPL